MTNRTSPDLSVDDLSIVSLIGDLTPIDDAKLAQALTFSPNVNGTARIATPDSDVYRLVELPDTQVDPTLVVLGLSTNWNVPTESAVAHIDAELSVKANLVGIAYYNDTDEGYAVKIGKVMTTDGTERHIAAMYRTGQRWTLTFWGYTTDRSPSGLANSLTEVRQADRSMNVPEDLLGERVLVQFHDTGEVNARGFAVLEAESYRVMDHTEDGVGAMRKLSRLVRTANARVSGLDTPDETLEQMPEPGTTQPLPA